MIVRLAEHMGMCFGVRDAVDLALRLTRQGPLTILGDLVHNPDVVAQLDDAGAMRARDLADVGTRSVLLTAHGAADRVKRTLRLEGHQVHDATCPLVQRAHRALHQMAAEGRFPIVIGKKDHVEVRGLVGDLDDYAIILHGDDLSSLDEPVKRNPRLGIVAQTTQPLALVEGLVAAIRYRYPEAEARFIDTVCQPTKDRQQAVADLATKCDVIVVAGGPDSNNSRQLVEQARGSGRPAYLVANETELEPVWFANKRVVGLTAGTSTPNSTIEAVHRRLEEMEPAPLFSAPAW